MSEVAWASRLCAVTDLFPVELHCCLKLPRSFIVLHVSCLPNQEKTKNRKQRLCCPELFPAGGSLVDEHSHLPKTDVKGTRADLLGGGWCLDKAPSYGKNRPGCPDPQRSGETHRGKQALLGSEDQKRLLSVKLLSVPDLSSCVEVCKSHAVS